jgi:hypothetical protein
MTHSLRRYSKVDVKRERVQLDRQEFSQYLSKQVGDKLTKAVQSRSLVERERQRWAQSVLIKHQR